MAHVCNSSTWEVEARPSEVHLRTGWGYLRPSLKSEIKTEGAITAAHTYNIGELRWEDHQFKVSLGYSDTLSQNKQERTLKNTLCHGRNDKVW